MLWCFLVDDGWFVDLIRDPPDSVLLQAADAEVYADQTRKLSEALLRKRKLDAEPLLDASSSLGHHLDHLRGRRRAVVLDEVRVLLGEAGAADPQAAAAGGVKQLAGAAALGGRVGRGPRERDLVQPLSHHRLFELDDGSLR